MFIKKSISVILATLMLFVSLSSLTVFAEETTQTDENNDKPVYIITDYDYNNVKLFEEKYICDTAVEADFVDNQIIIGFFHEESIKFKDYTAEDFKEYGVVDVEKLTYLEETITEFCNAVISELGLEPEYIDTLKTALEHNHLIDLDISEQLTQLINDKPELGEKLYSIFDRIHKFNQVLVLTLDTHDKQNVLDTIKELEKDNTIMYAQPNYIYYIDPIETQPVTTGSEATPDTPAPTTGNNNLKNNNSNGAIPTGQNNPLPLLCLLIVLSLGGILTVVKSVKKNIRN